MKAKDREIVFNKYGGKCAYCGTDLVKGWHVDELKPVRRHKKHLPAGWYHKKTKAQLPLGMDWRQNNDYEYKKSRYVNDGCRHPERFNIDNQMPACASCNINKHSMDLEEFRNLITGFMKHLNELNTQYKIAKRYGLVTENIKPIVFYFETPDLLK